MRGGGDVVWEVVVIFHGFEGERFPEEAKVVDWDGGREEGLDCWRRSISGLFVSMRVD